VVLAGLACLAAEATATPPPIIVAHRGLSEGVPENSLAAFRRSIARGIPIIELDLRVTSDGQLVVLHDRTLDRTTDCTGKVAAMARARVEACGVPTFAEVIALVRGTPVRILADVKTGTPLAPVLEAVHEQHAAGQIILGLRSVDHVIRARAELPGVTILAFMPRVGDAPTFANAGAQIIRMWSDWVEADPALIARTRALGPQVWVLVGQRLPKTQPEWRALHGRMLRLGPDGLITDRPEWIPEAAR
jgi:glycerophosphoryl diester phosphodiesterase